MKTLFILVPIILLGVAFAGGLGKEGPFGPRVPSGIYATLTESTPSADQKTLQINTVPAVLHTPSPSVTPPPTCTPSTKVAVDFLIDTSGSMCETDSTSGTGGCSITGIIPSDSKMGKLKIALIEFAEQLKTGDLVGIQTFETTANSPLSLGSFEKSSFLREVNNLNPSGTTNMRVGFTEAESRIRSVIGNFKAHNWVLILISDGKPNHYDVFGVLQSPEEDSPLYPPDLVKPIKDLGVTVFTIGFGLDAVDSLLRSIASSNPVTNEKYFYEAPSASDILGRISQIAEASCIQNR